MIINRKNLRDRYTFDIKSIIISLFYMLFLLMMVTPTTLQSLKTILLFLICLLAIPLIIRQWRLPISIYILFISSIFIMSLYTLYGYLNGNPGALPSVTVIIIYPVIYFMFSGLLGSNRLIKSFEVSVDITLLFIILINVLFFLNRSGYIGFDIVSVFATMGADIGGTYGNYGGRYEYNLYSISSLIFLVPLVISMNILRFSRELYNHKVRLLFRSALVVLSVFLIFLSGRRAFVFIFFLSIPLSIFVLLLKEKKIRSIIDSLLSVVIFFTISLAAYFFILKDYLTIDSSNSLADLLSAFDLEGDPSSSLRGLQIEALLHDFWLNPFFGYGTGYANSSVVRDLDQPWAYEVMYIALLNWFGALGYLLIGSTLLYTVVCAIKVLTRKMDDFYTFAPYIIAFALFMIANATNPYLLKFDYLWILFVPCAIVVHISNRNYKEPHGNSSNGSEAIEN